MSSVLLSPAPSPVSENHSVANTWSIAAVGWGFVVVGWLISPIMTFLVSKFLPYIGFDASRKLRELEIHTVPKLEKMLTEVEEKRMQKEAVDERSAVKKLEQPCEELRSALYEAQDILDLIDYHQIKNKVNDCDDDDITSLQHLRDAIRACINRCRSSWLGECLCSLWHAIVHRSSTPLPTSRPPPESVDPLPLEGDVVPSVSLLQGIRCFYKDTCFYRDWSYEVIGITSYKGSDSFLSICARRKLRKRIEAIEIFLTDWKHLCTESLQSPRSNKERSSRWDTITSNYRQSIKTVTKPTVFGRDEEREAIHSILREGPDDHAASSSSSKCYRVICIHGIAGSGKTTLAQYVCDYEKEDKDKYFDHIMLIHVSETLKVDYIFHDMLEQITKNRHSDITDGHMLHNKLVEELRGRRFLLVLDDVNDNNDQKHRDLVSPLDVGKRGSRILVTARRTDVAIRANIYIEISDLDKEIYFSMFMHYALEGTSCDDRDYIPIGRRISEKLYPSPIAAVIVGGRLKRTPDITFWRATSNLEVFNSTTGALLWSYLQLDVDVRRCFEYCSIFPRRYELERDMLIRMWIAQGLVKTSNAREEDMEDVGQLYFHELQTYSFLQLKRKDNPSVSSNISSWEFFTVHDSLYDVAKMVAGSDRVEIKNGIEHIPKYVRHVCIVFYDEVFPEQILELENLRTLMMCYSVKKMSTSDFKRVVMRLKKLRVLQLDLQPLSTIPACIGDLKQLRHLALNDTSPRCSLTLPPEFTKLYHLQEFLISPRSRLSTTKMGDLVNLRYLHIWKGLDIPDIGRMKLLRNLFRFVVTKEKGYEIHQLENLNNLRGSLYIDCLDNVRSKEDALRARLAQKIHLTDLTLNWGGTVDSPGPNREKEASTALRGVCSLELQAEVFEALHPPSGIKYLRIKEYHGRRYPSWLTGEGGAQQGDFTSLQGLMFWSCHGLDNPHMISERFGLLRELIISECSWNSLPDNLNSLAMLEKLILEDCRHIQSLPTLPRSLTSITILNCSPTLVESCQTNGHPNWQKIRAIAIEIDGPVQESSISFLKVA